MAGAVIQLVREARSHRYFLYLFGFFLVARTVFAWILPLGVDEAYQIAVGRDFSLSFFDHPPLSFWAPSMLIWLTGWETPLLYRLPSLCFGSVTIWVLYLIGQEIHSKRAGLYGAIFYAAAPFFFFSGGLFVVPDGPLNMATAVAAYWLIRAVESDGNNLAPWVWAGVATAVALLSKYQAGLLPIATLLFLITSSESRHWLTKTGPWIAASLGLFGLIPVLLWNLQNDWASFAFHTSRTGTGLSIQNLVTMIIGQLLYLLPSIAVLAVYAAFRQKDLDHGRSLLLWLGLTPIVAFSILYLFSNSSLPHWTMPGWLLLLPLAGTWVVEGSDRRVRVARRWLDTFAVPIWALALALTVQVTTGFFTQHTSPKPNWDQTLDLFDWSELEKDLAERGLEDQIGFIAVRSWTRASAISTGLGGKYPVRVIGGNPHHFQFLPQGQGVGLYLEAARLEEFATLEARVKLATTKLDAQAKSIEPIVLKRGGFNYAVVVGALISLEGTE
jgi:4-amino-4-deoxy-L-arabinose transferase-like glycosyltransferase